MHNKGLSGAFRIGHPHQDIAGEKNQEKNSFSTLICSSCDTNHAYTNECMLLFLGGTRLEGVVSDTDISTKLPLKLQLKVDFEFRKKLTGSVHKA